MSSAPSPDVIDAQFGQVEISVNRRLGAVFLRTAAAAFKKPRVARFDNLDELDGAINYQSSRSQRTNGHVCEMHKNQLAALKFARTVLTSRWGSKNGR